MRTMTHEVLPFLIALTLGVCWMILGIPLCFRMFGISLPLNPRKRSSVKLSFEQTVFVSGVLYWGVSMFIFHNADIYVRWWLYGSPMVPPPLSGFAESLLEAVIGGLIFGLMSAWTSSSAKAKQ